MLTQLNRSLDELTLRPGFQGWGRSRRQLVVCVPPAFPQQPGERGNRGLTKATGAAADLQVRDLEGI